MNCLPPSSGWLQSVWRLWEGFDLLQTTGPWPLIFSTKMRNLTSQNGPFNIEFEHLKNEKKNLRGHLKSSHWSRTNERTFIWNFTPSLPLSRKESVIDNGRNVWQIYFKDRLWRLTKAFTKRSLSIEGSGFKWNSRYSTQPSQTMSSISRMQGCFPGGSASISKKKQGDNLEQSKKKTISAVFFSFSACSRADGRCTSTRCLTGARSTWPSKAQSISADRPLPMRAPSPFEKRQRRPWILFLEIWRCKHCGPLTVTLFFFYCRSHSETCPNPLPRYESSFVCLQRVKFWDDPLQTKKKKKKWPLMTLETVTQTTSGISFFGTDYGLF